MYRFQYTWPLSTVKPLCFYPRCSSLTEADAFSPLAISFSVKLKEEKKHPWHLILAKWGIKYPWLSFLFRCSAPSWTKSLIQIVIRLGCFYWELCSAACISTQAFVAIYCHFISSSYDALHLRNGMLDLIHYGRLILNILSF